MFWKKKQPDQAAVDTPTPIAELTSAELPGDMDPQSKRLEIQKSPEEKRFLLKLDLLLLSYGCISQVIKYLDQGGGRVCSEGRSIAIALILPLMPTSLAKAMAESQVLTLPRTNINTAYVSGMSEALNFQGNELNYFATYFNVGYCIFLIPSQVFITYFRPSWWLPALELVWGILTGCIAACNEAKPIYALRALIGAAESSSYPGTVTLLMAWYTPLEMAKRIGFYHSCQAVGGMLSGVLQTAIHQSLEGKHGIVGWRWTFIINCIMTVVLAAIGPFLIPDFPDRPNPRCRWITPRDREIALRRLDRFHRVDVSPINFHSFVRTLKNPFVYLAIYIYVGLLIAVSGLNYFQLWLKSLLRPDGTKVWGISQLNAIPMGGYAMQIAGVWLFAFGSDYFKTRWGVLLLICLLGLPSTIIMTIWDVPNSAKYYAYFMLFPLQSHGPPLWAWLSDMLPADAEQRALIIAVCITGYYAINAWSNVLIFPAKQAPHYTHGWAVCLALFVTCGLVICAMRVYDLKIIRPANYAKAQETIAAQQADEAEEKQDGLAKVESVQ